MRQGPRLQRRAVEARTPPPPPPSEKKVPLTGYERSRRKGNYSGFGFLMISLHSRFPTKAIFFFLRRFRLKRSRMGEGTNTHLQTPTVSRKFSSTPSIRTRQLRNWQKPQTNWKNTDRVCLLTTEWNCLVGASLDRTPYLPWLRRKLNKP